MNKTSIFVLFVGVILFFSIGLTSANTLVMGKVYDSNFSQIIPDAEVIIHCNESWLFTTSRSDGTYAVIFDTPDCDNSLKVEINVSKDRWSGKGSSIINSSGGLFNLVVININMQEGPVVEIKRVSRSHKTNYFLCGNGICDSGEKVTTCPEDCTTPSKEPIINEIPTEVLSLNTGKEIILETNQNNPGITGAITGVFGSGSTIFLVFALAFLLIIGIIVIVLRKS